MKLYTISEVVGMTKLSPSTLHRWMEAGYISGTTRVGNNKIRLFSDVSIRDIFKKIQEKETKSKNKGE